MDTKPELGVCGQCGAYVLACHVGGLRVSADTLPLSMDAYRAALVAGRTTYRLLADVRGAPRRLDFDGAGVASDLPRLAAHGCNAVPRPLEMPETPQHGSVCALWVASGWNPPARCPRRSQGGTGPQSCQDCCPPPF